MRPPPPDLALLRFEVLHESEAVAVLRLHARWSAEPTPPVAAPQIVVDDGSREHRFAARPDPGCDPAAPLWRASCRVPAALTLGRRTAYALAFGPGELIDLAAPRLVAEAEVAAAEVIPAAEAVATSAPAPAAEEPSGALGAIRPRPGPHRRPHRTTWAASGAALLVATFAWPAAGSGTAPPAATEPAGAVARLAAFPVAPLRAARDHVPHRALYVGAARRYGVRWALLAAVGDVETRHGRARLPGVRAGTSAGGAAGPAQFTPATWAAYGQDASGDGRLDVYDPRDAIPAMAAFLRAHGAPGDEARALFAYNASHAYVQRVLARAQRYAAAG